MMIKGIELPKRTVDLDRELKKLRNFLVPSSEAGKLLDEIIKEHGVDGAIAHKQKRADRTQRRKEKK